MIAEGEGVAAEALKALGISLEAVRQQVVEIIGQGQQAPSGHIPFTPRVKKVLELALREALQLGHNYVGTEHILLGLIREGDGVAAQVLVKLGADLNRTRQQVILLLHGVDDYSSGLPDLSQLPDLSELNALSDEHLSEVSEFYRSEIERRKAKEAGTCGECSELRAELEKLRARVDGLESRLAGPSTGPLYPPLFPPGPTQPKFDPPKPHPFGTPWESQ